MGLCHYPNAKKDALPLWVADMDFACAKPVQKALRRIVDVFA